MKNENDILTIYNPGGSVKSHSSNKDPPIRAASRDGSYHSVESADFTREDTSELVIKKKSGCKEKIHKIRRACCSSSAKKIFWGFYVTVFITAAWVITTHLYKYLFHSYRIALNTTRQTENNGEVTFYRAPFFTTWLCTNWLILFFPIYYLLQLSTSNSVTASEILGEGIRIFRSNNLTIGCFIVRCVMFCMLWVLTNYMYIYSLDILLATDVIALFATNVSYVYLLSWVILHEQFVGLRIVAIILCATGVAQLAYMDGISSPVLSSVFIAAGSALGYGIFKVSLKSSFGDLRLSHVALFFSFIGLLNAILLWPICLALYFADIEVLEWNNLPWPILFATSVTSLITNLLRNFSFAVTYDLFVVLSLITSVPVSAALDVVLYGAIFRKMELPGLILIAIGFFLVLFPDNWPDYITRVLRWNRKNRNSQLTNQRTDMDYRTGYIRSHLRSPSGRVR